jgi:cytochrome c biogenesis protein CcdA
VDFGPATYALGLAAGALSTLSPCVLPLIPVLVASAANAHRWGPLALGVGLALSYTVMGLGLAPLGASLGLDPDTFRTVGAAALILFGVILLVPQMQGGIARAAGAFGDAGERLLQRVTIDGLSGQLLVGLVLGIVWTPCVGPTLGAATTLASRGQNLGQIAALMVIFGVGAAAPLVALGMLSRATLLRIRGRLLSAGSIGKKILGVVFVGLGVLIATGLDQHLQAWVLDRSPPWLTALTTRF